METAKVDIRKLQTLNDCINRTIEALNQVRLSVHGGSLSHSAPIGMAGIGTPFGAYGAFASPFGVAQQQLAQQQLAQQIAQQQLASQIGNPMLGMVSGYGLGHTAATNPFNTWNTWNTSSVNPFVQSYVQNPLAYASYATNPLAFIAQTGLAHSGVTGVSPFNTVNGANGWENTVADPYATARIAQTFPFVHWGYSPFTWPNV